MDYEALSGEPLRDWQPVFLEFGMRDLKSYYRFQQFSFKELPHTSSEIVYTRTSFGLFLAQKEAHENQEGHKRRHKCQSRPHYRRAGEKLNRLDSGNELFDVAP